MADPVKVASGQLVEALIEQLRDWLPHDWQVLVDEEPVPSDGGLDVVLSLRSPSLSTRVVVEARRSVTPKDVGRSVAHLRSLRAISPDLPLLVVAPWISSRTREALTAGGAGFVDLTGNADIRISRPPIIVRTMGADRDPSPGRRSPPALKGPLAGRLVRLITEVRPPYGVGELARAVGVSVPYVSRLLDTLDREALIRRGRRGRVEDADWAELLRRRAGAYSMLETNRAATYVAPTGAADAFAALREATGQPAVTGSFVAARIAPVAAPGLLAVYAAQPDRLVEELGLLPADVGADVAVLSPYDESVLARTMMVDGIRAVGMSQLALDCLTGPGRMPAEGEALIDWMAAHQDDWRLPELPPAGAA